MLPSFHTIAVALAIASGLGVTGLAVLAFALPAAFAVVMAALERVLGRLIATRGGCVFLALLVGLPVAYGVGSNDEAVRARLRDAQAIARFNEKIAGAARVAATRDQARAAAAEAARAQAEDRAHALEAQIPTTACFAPADTERLRRLWQPAARQGDAAAAADAIAGLLHRRRQGAGGGPAR